MKKAKCYFIQISGPISHKKPGWWVKVYRVSRKKPEIYGYVETVNCSGNFQIHIAADYINIAPNTNTDYFLVDEKNNVIYVSDNQPPEYE